MSLSRKQKDDLKSLNKLDSRVRASVKYRIRSKLEDELDRLGDIEIMLSDLPRDHAKKAVKDKHVAKAMNILLALLDLREFKRVRQNSPGEEGYIIKKFRGRYRRVPLTQKDYNRYRAMLNFAIYFKKFFNPKVILPGEVDLDDISPIYSLNEWAWIDDQIDYQIHLQRLYGDSQKPIYKMSESDRKRIAKIEKKLFDPAIDLETRIQLAEELTGLNNQILVSSLKDLDLPIVESEKEQEELTRKAIQRNIDATNDWIEFFKSTH